MDVASNLSNFQVEVDQWLRKLIRCNHGQGTNEFVGEVASREADSIDDDQRQPKFEFSAPIVEIPEWRLLAVLSVIIALITFALLLTDATAGFVEVQVAELVRFWVVAFE